MEEALTKKVGIVFLFLFLITSVNALSFNPSFPYNTTLNCGESLVRPFILSDITEDVTIVPGTIASNNFHMSFSQTFFSQSTSIQTLYLSFFEEPGTTCNSGTSNFWFKINGVRYDISLEVSEDLWLLDSILLSEGKRVDIGGVADFGVVTIDDDRIRYILKGCANDYDDFLDVGQSVSEICEGEKIKIELESAFGDPFSFAKIKVYSSEAGFNLVISNGSTQDDENLECELGLDTLGAKVTRGNLFAIKTINANTGKYEKKVVVTILDQEGELSPIVGESSNIGFFSKRLFEEYKQNLIVQLEKEGCEPSTQVILFEQSYDDYKKAKGEEEGAYQLVLNFTETRFVVGNALSNIIKNALGTGIDSVEVKITKPDSTSFIVNTDTSGSFSFTPEVIGFWKIQGGKDNYQSTDLREIEVYSNKEYLIVIEVDGEPKSTYKKGDRLTFKLVDINNTIIPLNIDATFAGLPLKFISGISDAVTFEDTCSLIIPATEGYIEQQLQLNAKESSWVTWLYWILGVIAGIVILILLILIIRKIRGRSKSPKKSLGFGANIKTD